MTQPTIAGFFSGGGGKSLSWKDVPVGTTYSGTILAVHPPEQQTDVVTKMPVFKKDGVTPKMSVRIDLQTNLRDPSDPDDDGRRGLYVQGWMQGAIGDALRKAGANEPEVGGQLAVQLSERTPNDTPGLNPINKFIAQYVKAPVTNGFFGVPQSAAQAPQPQAPQQPVPQPNISGVGYVQQATQAAQQPLIQQVPPQAPVAQQPLIQQPPQQFQPPQQQLIPQQAQAPAGPVKPDSISQDVWNTMDDSTKQAVANTFQGLAGQAGPPF